ncbi:unnamed protein product (macronuclear) [Paramecium tetraurelia]|uniref:Uncharacterized protein n=1 Tax=Paramecium tetraurelia TaxID=5888 RepID=A0C748_PARTE|nr:uncharacterized protein GSPATT00035745001 [Paramecium tetraurelia]CAK66615.1 unnamed protein product [Paramecium tetraurelia]|eukprot:XP_001434012.1 hypothetical protein (macronuclear) [Paramecium tetraurelia strain d4-2]
MQNLISLIFFRFSIKPEVILNEYSQLQNQHQIRNFDRVFSDQILLGPIFDKHGVIERSIVGKPDIFYKVKEQQRAGIKFVNQTNISNTTMKFVRRISSRKSTNLSNKQQQQQQQQQQHSEHSQRNEQTKRNKDFDLVSKQDLIKLCRLIESRVNQNKESSDQIVRKQSQQKIEQLKLIQQNKVLNKYECQLKLWNEEISKSINTTNRTSNESILNSCSCIEYILYIEFRRKIEQIQLQEALKLTQGEKTINQWYMSLRQSEAKEETIQEDTQHQSVFQDVNNKNALYVDPKYRQLEIIRQPSFYMSQQNSINPDQRLRFNSTNLSFYQQQLPYFQLSGVHEENIEELIVEGLNKYKIEKEYMLEQADNQKFRLYKQAEEQYIDELIDE